MGNTFSWVLAEAATLTRPNVPPLPHLPPPPPPPPWRHTHAPPQLHNGYRTISDNSKLAHLHPSSSFLGMDEDGMLPEWIVYHEFIATSKPFLSKARPPPPLPRARAPLNHQRLGSDVHLLLPMYQTHG